MFQMQNQQLSGIMLLSWEIQRKKNYNRSKALLAAWTIALNEDITVYYLIKKHSGESYPNRINSSNLVYFLNSNQSLLTIKFYNYGNRRKNH